VIPISDAPGVRRTFPIVNILIILANIVVFIFVELTQPSERALEQLIMAAGVIPTEIISGRDLPPLAPLGNVYLTLLTAMFLHGGFLHLAGNMLYLWVFGDNVEDTFGHLGYTLFYLVCGVLAGLTHIVANAQSSVPSIGASGAIAGVLGAYLIMFPHASIRTLVFLGPFITMPRVSALFLIGFWFVLQLLSGVASLGVEAEQTSGVAVWAHVGGFVAGFILVHFFRFGAPKYSGAAR
jgi:membrane associated rhomboid family serine protease